MKNRQFSKLIACVCMILALVISLASCDLFAQKAEEIGGVKPHELYRTYSRKYRDAKESNGAVTLNVTWTKSVNPDFEGLVTLVYNNGEFSASIAETNSDSAKNENAVYMDGAFYYTDSNGGKHSYQSTRNDVINYVDNETLVKYIQPALFKDYPDNWFDGKKLIVADEETYVLKVEVDAAKSLAMRDYSSFYAEGSKVEFTFNKEGALTKISLTNVKVNLENSNITIELDWNEDNKVSLPSSNKDYQNKGFYSYSSSNKPGTYHEHAFGQWSNNTATCTAGGTETRKCTIAGCDEIETRNSSALGHDEIFHEGKKATCFENGYKDYVTCTRCDYTTYAVESADGHSMGKWIVTVAPTCSNPGTEVSTCTLCDQQKTREIAPLGHDIKTVEEKEPTCNESGWNAYEMCTRCDYSTKVEITNLHNLSSWKTDVAATCNEGGSEHRYCFLCEYTEQRDTAPLGHKLGELLGNTATCTEAGTATKACERCDYTETYTTEPLGHDEITHAAKDAACTTIGWYDYVTCSRCDYTTYVEIEALGHDEIAHEAKDATCTTIGWYAYVTCSRCDLNTYEEIDALGHDMGDWYGNSATCTESGTETKDCSRCDYSETQPTAPLGHDEIDHEAKDATCTTVGWYAYVTCLRCDLNTYEEIDALGHDMGDWYGNSATCTESGTETKDCSRCDYSETQPTAPLGHLEVTHEGKDATCTEDGWNAYVTCERCDLNTYEKQEALGHDEIEHDAQDYTCTEFGWHAYITCSRCDYTTYEEIPAAHRMGDWYISIEGSCTEAGELKRECSMCDYYEIEVVEAMHNEVHHEAQAPTCTEDGWGEYVSCSKCDYSTKDEVIIPATHSYGDWQHKDSECTSCGSDYRICSACGHKEVTYLPATGHSYVDGVCEHCNKSEDDYKLPVQPLE